jgi:hypothetical protein
MAQEFHWAGGAGASGGGGKRNSTTGNGGGVPGGRYAGAGSPGSPSERVNW